MSRLLSVDIGVFASNEETNIESALLSIIQSSTQLVKIRKIIVVSSGSFDHTNSIVRTMITTDNRIQLIDEAERKGKASAINLFIRHSKAPILITMSADLTLSKRAIEEICLPFFTVEVGMVGARPVPRNIHHNPIGKEVKLLWELHHQISLIQPKCGELVAFRNVIREIPLHSAVDEATIEVLLKLIGYQVLYAPKAVVYNKGPRSLHEYLVQRRRVYTGHQWVLEKYQYKVVTMMPTKLLQVVFIEFLQKPTLVLPIFRLLMWELFARTLGWIDYHVLGKNPYVWKMISR
jgi:poly-beta-1,6-N-acetyl-D-glucosamine synthase